MAHNSASHSSADSVRGVAQATAVFFIFFYYVFFFYLNTKLTTAIIAIHVRNHKILLFTGCLADSYLIAGKMTRGERRVEVLPIWDLLEGA